MAIRSLAVFQFLNAEIGENGNRHDLSDIVKHFDDRHSSVDQYFPGKRHVQNASQTNGSQGTRV